jgi:pantoate kinase
LLRNPVSLSVEHLIQTPITAGFGSSGGGALSLSLALNEVLETGCNRLEAAQIAHIAEIECKTGLGSVYAAEVGGFGVLTKPGAPGIGESFSFDESCKYRVIYIYYGPIPTKDALSNPDLRRRVNQLGGKFVDMLMENFSPQRFLQLSREFTEYVDIVTPRLWKLFDYMDKKGYTFTMAMFGEVAFTVQHVDLVDDVLFSLSKISDSKAVVCKIDEDGARFL